MSNFREWLDNPHTSEFRKAVKDAIGAMQESSRLISGSVDETALMNAKVQGFIEGLEEVETIIDDLIEDSPDD